MTEGARVTMAFELFAHPREWEGATAQRGTAACCAAPHGAVLAAARRSSHEHVPFLAALMARPQPSPALSSAASELTGLPPLVPSVTDAAHPLLHALHDALETSAFMVNGGRLGFACQVQSCLLQVLRRRRPSECCCV